MFSMIETNLDRYAGNFPVSSVPADSRFYLTTLLLHGDGSNGAQNNTFLDSSTNAATITRSGTTTQGTFSPFGQTGWSNYFNGSSDYFTLPTSFIGAMGSGTSSDYTLECWVYLNAAPTGGTYSTVAPIVCTGAIWEMWSIANNGYLFGNRAGAYVTALGTTPTVGTWNHLAFVNIGTSMTVYLNGTSVATCSLTGTWVTNQTTYIGTAAGYSYLNGYISNLRITTTVRYTGNFTPSTVPLTAVTGTILLTCQNNRFVDNSASPYTLTTTGNPSVQPFSPFAPTDAYGVSSVGGSGYFNGTSDYLSVNATTYPSVKLGSGNFTLECWVYITSHKNYNTIYDCRSVTTNATGLVLACNSSGQLYVYNNGYVLDSGSGSAATVITANAWHHIALVRSGSAAGNLGLYVDGVRVAVSSLANTNNLSDAVCTIGYGSADANYYFTGYISNFRILVGTAQYSGTTYTIPSTPLTAIANTSFLLNGTNAGVYDSTARNDFLTSSAVTISTSQSKFGGSSIYFDGTVNSSLRNDVNSSGAVVFRTGDFTVECWFYPTVNSGTFACLITSRVVTITNSFFLGMSGLTPIYYRSAAIITAGGAVTSNTWNHLALVRYNGTSTLYLNGTSTGTPVSDSTDFTDTAVRLGYDNSQSAFGFTGYMDDIRITKYARYTATFTPPTASFFNQ
jgi:hypothetical protein